LSGYFPDIESLLKHAVSWARDHDRGCLYGKSADCGEINLRIDDEHCFEESFYSTITISSASIPLGRRNEGLYRRFLQELDEIGKFGLRCHSVTENSWLTERHRKHGYIEKKSGGYSSFYVVIGKPLSASAEARLVKQRSDVLNQIRSGLSGRSRGLYRKPRAT
jgi:hypothetical protein